MLIIWLRTGRKWGVIGSGEGFVYIWQLREPVMTSTTDTSTTQAALRMIYIYDIFNSATPSAGYMRQWTGSALVQIMACRLFETKPLPEPMLTYCQLDY